MMSRVMWKVHIVEAVERFVDDSNGETSTDDEMAALHSGMDLM
jgi:hypothetical protein